MEYTRLRYRDPQHHCNKKAAYLYFQVLENKVGQIINNNNNNQIKMRGAPLIFLVNFIF